MKVNDYGLAEHTEQEIKEFDIWLGYYHLGQGYDPPTKPEKIATVKSISFPTACLKYELATKLEWIMKAEETGQYISNQDREWWYHPKENSNGWTGRYFETEEEALKSFPTWKVAENS